MVKTYAITLRCLLMGLALAGGGAALGADAWPARPVHLIVPYAAGGFSDQTARVIGMGHVPGDGEPPRSAPGGLCRGADRRLTAPHFTPEALESAAPPVATGLWRRGNACNLN